MKDARRTKAELIEELRQLRSHVRELEREPHDLAVAERQLRALYQNFPLPTYTWQAKDDDFVLIAYNSAANEMTGGGVQSFVGIRAREIYADRPDILEDLRRCSEQGQTFQREMEYDFRTTAQRKPLFVTYACVPPDLVVVYTEDLSETRQLFASLDVSRRWLREITTHAPVVVYMKGPDGQYLGVNARFAELLGLEADEIIGRTDRELLPKRMAEVFSEHDREVLARGCPVTFEESGPHPGGVVHHYLSTKFPVSDADGRVCGVGGISVDVTEQKQALEALRASEARYRAVVEDQTELICRFKPDCILTFVNGAYCRYFGKTRQQLVGVNWLSFLPEEDHQVAKRELEALSKTSPCATYEHRVVLEDGTVRWQEWTDRAIFDAAGTVLEYQSVGRDTTEHRRIEQALREEKQFTEEMLDTILDTVFVFEPSTGKPLRWNRAFNKVSGYTDEEIASKRAPDEWYSEDDLAKTKVENEKLLRGEKSLVEMSLITKDGTSIPTEYVASMVPDRDGNLRYIIAAGRDIAERKQAEEALQLSRDLLAVANRDAPLADLLKAFAAEIKRYTGCAAVGIRLLDDDGNIPYEANDGFSREFCERESPLCIKSDQCMCINVITGETEAALAFYTERGSFYINGTTRFLSTAPQNQKGQTRNVCNEFGYESVALVPVRLEHRITGLIHVADPRENMVPEEKVAVLEHAGLQVGAALERVRLTEDVRRARDELEQRVLERTADLREALTEIQALKDRLQAENVCLREEVRRSRDHPHMVGASAAMRQILAQAEQVADTDSTVLILGETGTGKELLAEAIHAMSRRKRQPLVKVNCAALPPQLVEAELFGREKGAYTGALTRQIGRFELANGSTLFLDEIGALAPELQTKLLRVVQSGEFERLGSSKTIQVDTRIIAATNRDLDAAVRDGTFREDLFYRLSVFPITVPPLRDRREDIPQLVWAFVRDFSERMGKRVDAVSRRNLELLQRHDWPGNVRQLRNVVERAMILAHGPTLQVEPPLPSSREPGPPRPGRTLEDIERAHIVAVLEQVGWRVGGPGGAAEALGMKRTTLQARMQKLGIRRPRG